MNKLVEKILDFQMEHELPIDIQMLFALYGVDGQSIKKYILDECEDCSIEEFYDDGGMVKIMGVFNEEDKADLMNLETQEEYTKNVLKDHLRFIFSSHVNKDVFPVITLDIAKYIVQSVIKVHNFDDELMKTVLHETMEDMEYNMTTTFNSWGNEVEVYYQTEEDLSLFLGEEDFPMNLSCDEEVDWEDYDYEDEDEDDEDYAYDYDDSRLMAFRCNKSSSLIVHPDIIKDMHWCPSQDVFVQLFPESKKISVSINDNGGLSYRLKVNRKQELIIKKGLWKPVLDECDIIMCKYNHSSDSIEILKYN